MRLISLAGMAWRLFIKGRGGSRTRPLAAGVALGMATYVLCAAAAAVPTYHARHDRTSDRILAEDKARASASVPDRYLQAAFDDAYRGRTIHVLRLVVHGRPAALPAGLTRIPQPGTAAASPALASLLRSEPELARRYPARVVATVSASGLVGPDELVYYEGVRESALPAGANVGTSFGGARTEQPAPASIRAAVPLGVVGLLVPLLFVVGLSARLGSVSRTRRSHALQLLGLPRWQARLLEGQEVAGGALAGVGAGLAIYATTTDALARYLPVPDGVWPDMLALRPWTAFALMFGLPLLAVFAALLGSDPVGRPTRHRMPRVLPRWVLLLLPSAAALALVSRALDRGRDSDALVTGTAGAAAVLTVAGLILGGPAIAACAGRIALAGSSRLPLRLGARRVFAQPRLAARPVLAGALLTFAAGVSLTLLPVVAASSSAGDSGTLRSVFTADVLQSDIRDSRTIQQLKEVPGVRAVVRLHPVMLNEGLQVTAVDCDELNLALRTPMPACDNERLVLTADAAAVALTAPVRAIQYVERGGRLELQSLGTLGPTAQAGTDPRLQRLGSLGVAGGLVPHMLLPAKARQLPSGQPDQLLVATDGSGRAVEMARTVLLRSGATTLPLTFGEQVRRAEAPARHTRQGLLAAIALGLLVTALSLAVSLVDFMLECIRSTSALTALGMPAGTLRRALAWQTAISALPILAISAGLSLLVGWAYTASAGDGPVRLPVIEIGGVAVMVLLALLIAFTAAASTVRNRWSPTHLT